MTLKEIAALIQARPDLAERFATMAAEPVTVETCLTATAAATILGPMLMGRAYEALAVIALDRRGRAIASEVLTSGGSDGLAIVDPRRIFRWALTQGKSGANSIILAHNHPSGDISPSPQDIDVTKRVGSAGRILGINLVDHLIIGDTNTGYAYRSFAENGYPLG